MVSTSGGPLGAGSRAFAALGRFLVRHPVWPVVVWVGLLVAAVPLLMHLGSATQNSASQVPSSAPSSVAAAALHRLYPGASSPATSILLFTGANITGPAGQAAVLNATAAIERDRSLTDVAAVDSLYSSYATYLAGQVALANGVRLASGLTPAEEAAQAANLSTLLWAPPASYVVAWIANVSAHPSTPPTDWNYPTYEAMASRLAPGTPAREVLDAFYLGVSGSSNGFNATTSLNGTGDCGAIVANVSACASRTASASGRAVLPSVLPTNASPLALALGTSLLDVGSVGNFSNATTIASAILHAYAAGSGISYRWLSTVAEAFPDPSASPSAVQSWATSVADGPVSRYPLPMPASMRLTFLARDGEATLVFVSFTIDDSQTTSSGSSPVFEDVAEIDRIVPAAVLAGAPGGTVGYVQTGPAPLDREESTVLQQNLAIVLPLTLLILVVITLLYFRSPLVLPVTFGTLGIAIGLGLGGLVLLSQLFGKVDSTAITLENTFVLGVGTDYSIFLVARYREELRRGAESRDAVVTSVTWAGQSIATSGGTAVLATLALAFSGVGLLSQWGETLSLAVALTVLISLTLVPALLVLVGPRVFWPEVRERAARAANEGERRIREGRTYFYRAGRVAQRRPWAIIGLVLIASAPLVYVAVTAPLGYDFYAQLPERPGPTAGLQALSDHFGPGDAFPTQVLLTFPSPLLSNGTTNASEFAQLADVTAAVNGSVGVATVDSPVGPGGASLPEWLGYGAAPLAQQTELRGLLDAYLGNDGRTVLLTVTPSSSGLSTESIRLLASLRSTVAGTLTADGATDVHTEFGGGAAVTTDLAAQTALAQDRMILAVSIGLVIVLFLVLRSVLIPLLAVGTILLSIGWAWGATQLLFVQGLHLSLFFFVPTVLFILILGLGIDYNIFLLTRVREERLRGRSSRDAVLEAVTRTGGIITAAAIILGGAFAALTAGDFVLLRAIGFSVATAVILDAMVVRTYLVPASLQILGDRVWSLRRSRDGTPSIAAGPESPESPG